MRTSWWAVNRLWLPLVPVGLAAMLAASSYHVKTFWYDEGLHHAVAAARPGDAVSVDIPYTDTAGRTAYRFRVRLEDVRRVASVDDALGEDVAIPEDAAAYQLRMSFSADPSVALSFCFLTIVDSRGRQYEDSLHQSKLCVPQTHPGPDPAFAKGLRRGKVAKGEDRPSTWTVRPVILLPRGTRPAEVRLWFAHPVYVSLPVPR